jgi:phosphinothricin acetyltransferase
MADMKIIECDAGFAEEIRCIFNEAIIHSTALYDYQPRSTEMMQKWFTAKEEGGFPVIGMVDAEGELMGFGSYGTFRAWPAYKYTVEHSLYVATKFRGQGIGKRLLQEIICRAEDQGYHLLIGGIDSENMVSKALHVRLGFSHAGTIREVGFKFGRWLDLDFYQLILKTPKDPRDG